MKNRNLHTALAAFFFAAFHVYGANTGNATIKLTPGGELATRVNRNFDRLEEPKYRPENVFLTMEQSGGWPGDTEGRTMLGLILDSQITGREPKYLDAILKRFPSELNERGYFGPLASHSFTAFAKGWKFSVVSGGDFL